MNGYINACLKSLSSTGHIDVAVAYAAGHEQAPYANKQFEWVERRYEWDTQPSRLELQRLLGPRVDAVLVNGWNIRGYRSVLRELGRSGVPRLLYMDNQYSGTPKQWLGRATWRQYIRPYFDAAFVPGERQAEFARLLGFGDNRIMRGSLTADTANFDPPAGLHSERPRALLYVGRLTYKKGVEILRRAYAQYRSNIEHPWPLYVAGTGPQLGVLEGEPGVTMLGFVQPSGLPSVMWNARVMVSPSLFEPWGVAIHEATAAGLIVIATTAAGAGVHLVQDGYNGYVVPTGDPAELAKALQVTTTLPDARQAEMSQASLLLSRQFSPDRWATYLVEMLDWRARADAVPSTRRREAIGRLEH